MAMSASEEHENKRGRGKVVYVCAESNICGKTAEQTGGTMMLECLIMYCQVHPTKRDAAEGEASKSHIEAVWKPVELGFICGGTRVQSCSVLLHVHNDPQTENTCGEQPCQLR